VVVLVVVVVVVVVAVVFVFVVFVVVVFVVFVTVGVLAHSASTGIRFMLLPLGSHARRGCNQVKS
jgi:hypothetical protein